MSSPSIPLVASMPVGCVDAGRLSRRALLRRLGGGGLVVGLGLVPWRVAAQGTPPAGMAGMGSPAASPAAQTWQQTVGPYRLTLVLGPPETMYTPAQVAAQHPTSGEVMLGGQMAMPGMATPAMGMATPMGGAMAGTIRHLELHVVEAATGRVVPDARVAITVVDETAHQTTALSIVTMQGVRAGAADFHYGNNVVLVPGHSYRVEVTVNGLGTTFAVRFGM